MPNPPPKRPPTAPAVVAIPPRKPERNVPAPVEDEADKTPVDMPLPALLERRARQTAHTVSETHSEVSLLRQDVAALDRKVDIYVENDAKEHAQLRDKFEQLDEQYKSLDGKVDELAVATATMHGKMDFIVDHFKAQQEVAVHREKMVIEKEVTEHKVRLETGKIELEDKVDEKKFKRQKWLKIIGIIATVITGLAAAIWGAS